MLSLELVPRRLGNAPEPLLVRVERPLVPADLERLGQVRDIDTSVLKRITDRHHALARLIASGMPHGEAGAACGYVPSRVSNLLTDPSFKELVQFYRVSEQKEFRDTAARLTGLAHDAIDLLEERLNDDEERKKIPTPVVMKVVEMAADRTGHGPASSTTNVNIHLGFADRLAEARRRAREAAQIDVTPKAAAE